MQETPSNGEMNEVLVTQFVLVSHKQTNKSLKYNFLLILLLILLFFFFSLSFIISKSIFVLFIQRLNSLGWIHFQ